MRSRIYTLVGAIGLAFTMLVINAPGSTASPPPEQYHVECTAHPGVTTSGNQVVFSGFIRCTPFVKGGTIFVLAYEGDSEVQSFKERTDKKCSIDQSRCDGKAISRAKAPGPQTYCSYVEAMVGVSAKTVERVNEKLCLAL